MRIASAISPLPPDKMDKQSVLDLLEGPEEEDIPDWSDQNGHYDNEEINGTSKPALNYSYDDEKNSSQGSITSNGSDERKAKRVELKSLLGNSLGSYWNDGSMMVDKRRRKQVVRYTTEDDKKENEGDEEDSSVIRPKRKSTSVLTEEKNEKVNLKKRARPQKNLINSTDTEFNLEPIKPDDSYYKLFETGSVLNSTIESTYDESETLVGSKRRKRSKPYTTSPYSVACQIALKPVRNFNICSYKQPSLLLKECSNFLIKDHSAVPLTLALEAAELIHVTQYKALMQTKKHVKRKLPYSKSKSDLDNRRPGYSRAKEELKGFLCKVTVERTIQSQQRATGADYQNHKRQLLEFLNNYNQKS